jgi:glycosyltransferase involved in cell wall biosynthesis
MLKVLVVGQTPPPFNGQAIMIEQLVKSDLADLQLIHVRMGFSSHMNELGRIRLSKILHLFGLIARIIFHRLRDGARVLYYPPGGVERVPMYRDMAVLISTRWLFDKTVFHFHAGGVSTQYDQLPAWRRWFFRRAYFGADAAIRISKLNPDDGGRLAAKRQYVIPNGIEDPCDGIALRRSGPRNSSDPLTILFVGVLSEAKGVAVLIEACERLADRGVPFQLSMIGQWESDAFANRIRNRVHDLDLSKQIRFVGALVGEEKFAAYHRADVFCFPTFFEGETFGLVLVEAMACGLPVVATRWRGIPSVVDDGTTGFLVEPRDPDAMAERLAALARDPRLCERMGSAGRAKFEREYTFARHANCIRRALLETAGVTVDAEPDINGDLAPHRPGMVASDNELAAQAEMLLASPLSCRN